MNKHTKYVKIPTIILFGYSLGLLLYFGQVVSKGFTITPEDYMIEIIVAVALLSILWAAIGTKKFPNVDKEKFK